MIKVLKYIWQLPQNLLGLLIYISCVNIYRDVDDTYVWEFKSGVSLGRWIFVSENCSMTTIKHERGHQQQSLYLGPLYLLLIGLPSLIGNLSHRIVKFDYYKQPWEKWADKLGGVRRL